MLKIDNSLLEEVGLGAMPEAEKNGFLKHIYETLEMRVGIRLADQMSNEQLDEFERYFEAKDDAGAFKWLETNFPNYKDIVQEEFDKLKTEVAQSAPQILAASQSAAAQAQPEPVAPPPAGPPQPLADPVAFQQTPPAPQPTSQPSQPANPYPPQPAPGAMPGSAPVPPPPPPMPPTEPLPEQPPYPGFPPQQPPAGPGPA